MATVCLPFPDTHKAVSVLPSLSWHPWAKHELTMQARTMAVGTGVQRRGPLTLAVVCGAVTPRGHLPSVPSVTDSAGFAVPRARMIMAKTPWSDLL